MSKLENFRVVIVDYGMGNLFSVQNACRYFGMDAAISTSRDDISKAHAVILPGVGAFGNAVSSLKKLDLFNFLIDVALSGKPFIGICLGLQLLMEKSSEFGEQNGLGIVKGSVIHFNNSTATARKPFNIPQVGWNRIFHHEKGADNYWKGSLLEGLKDGDFMYFVHSFYVVPDDLGIILSKTFYGNAEFCSSLRYKNIFACQFHPERSGLAGLNVYKNISKFINNYKEGE